MVDSRAEGLVYVGIDSDLEKRNGYIVNISSFGLL